MSLGRHQKRDPHNGDARSLVDAALRNPRIAGPNVILFRRECPSFRVLGNVHFAFQHVADHRRFHLVGAEALARLNDDIKQSDLLISGDH